VRGGALIEMESNGGALRWEVRMEHGDFLNGVVRVEK
jgi:hypothetical protein